MIAGLFAEASRSIRYAWLLPALAAIASAAAGRSCACTTAVGGPSLAWTGSDYLVAWSEWDGKGEWEDEERTIHLARSTDGSRPAKRAPIYRGRRLSSPVIFGDANSFLVVFTEDRTSDRYHPERSTTAIPLDREGRVTGPPIIGDNRASYLCDTPVAVNGLFVVGYKHIATSHRDSEYGSLMFLDRTGHTMRGAVFAPNGLLGCNLAANAGLVAVAWWFDDKVNVSFHPLRDVDPKPAGFSLPKASFHYSLTAYQNGWALLFHDPTGPKIILFDRNGPTGSLAVPRGIDSSSAVLAANDRGLFITWLEGRSIRARGLTGSRRSLKVAAGPQPEELSVIGHGDRCAVAWRNRGRLRINVLAASDCP